jgi:DNA-binding NarL/FixJ family response regulator
MKEPSPLDHTLARANPWGLTPHQCMVMRLHCKLGHVKAIWAETNISIKTIHWHLENIRNTMGIPGRDIRIFTQWDAWAREFYARDKKCGS